MLLRGRFGQARARDAKIKDPADRAAEDSRKLVLAPADIDSCHAALLVGRRTHRHITGLAGHQIGAFCAVTGRVNVRVGAAHAGIHLDCAGRTNLQAGTASQVHVRLHTNPQHH